MVLFKKKRLKKRFLFLIILIVLCVFAFRTDINVIEYSLKNQKISNNIKVAVVSDLHSCDYGDNQKELIHKINKAKPDIILMPGDIVDDVLPIEKTKEFLSVITKQYPCFYTSGNHEVWSNDIDNIKLMMKDFGVKILEGTNSTISINGNTLNILGVDDPEIGYNNFLEQIKQCNLNTNNTNFSILLSHRPELIDVYEQYNFDLIVSGHAHGGQWRIPFILNGLLAPNQGFFPKYAGGKYNFNNFILIVSRGLAKESTRVPRVFNRPEIVIINIESN